MKTTEEIERDFPEMFSNVYCGNSMPTGWGDLVYKLCEDISMKSDHIKVAQVKEKFGGLRFYIDVAGDEDVVPYETVKEIYSLISKAESESFKICEVCGEPGSTEGATSWITTKCSKHRAEELETRQKFLEEFRARKTQS